MSDDKHRQKQQQSLTSQGGWTSAGRWAIVALVVVGMLLVLQPEGRYRLPTISTNYSQPDSCLYQAHPAQLHLDLEGFDWGKAREQGYIGSQYVTERLDMRYYRTVVRVAEQYAPDAKSIIDVGAPWPFVTAFTWIPDKTMLNNRYPDGYKAPNSVHLVETDFYKFSPKQKYDVVICNQVLEHVPDPSGFAQKLLEIGKVVIVSVPYDWPAGPKGHLNHHIDQDELLKWFGNEPFAEVGVVREANRGNSAFGKRMYVVFDNSNSTRFNEELKEQLAYNNRRMKF